MATQQAATIAVEMVELYRAFAEQAKERQKEAGVKLEGKNPDGTTKLQVSQKIEQPEVEPLDPNKRKTKGRWGQKP